MELKYVGPHRGGLQQIGSTPMDVPWGATVELPDTVARALLEQAPDHWENPSPGFVCEHCEKSYKTESGWSRHVATHADDPDPTTPDEPEEGDQS